MDAALVAGMPAIPRPERTPTAGDTAVSLALYVVTLDGLADGVWICERDGSVRYRNRAAAAMESMSWSRAGRTGSMREIVFVPELLAQLENWESYACDFELRSATIDITSVHSIDLRLRSLAGEDGEFEALSLHARDVSLEWTREQALQDRHIELEAAYARLKLTQTQLLQSEKMASIGQLAAGVAHEINNPIGYVHSNLGTLKGYVGSLLELLDAYEALYASAPTELKTLAASVEQLKQHVDFAFLREDLPQLVEESREGIGRVKKIVLDLRDFSHAGEVDTDDWLPADLHHGLDSTLNLVWNDLKYKATLRKEYGVLPLVECMPSQLNQVFLNLLVNASHALTEHGEITIRTSCVDDEVCISIGDNGAGIAPELLPRIFDPFFTTKAVGKGTGLGLSLSFGIVQKHNGRIEVESALGVGTTFRIYLPVHRGK